MFAIVKFVLAEALSILCPAFRSSSSGANGVDRGGVSDLDCIRD